MNTKKTIMIIDGHSLMYRNFYAITHLSNTKGIPTNAVYGFLNTFLKLLGDYNPDYVGVAFDVNEPTFRHEQYAEYKAGRQKMPEDLIPQFDTLKDVLKLMDVPVYETSGFEADDILGTTAQLASENDMTSLLVTGDKDSLQLIKDCCKIVMMKKGGHVVYDEERLFEEYGIKPWQIIELKSLMGDTSDNIPGIKGIGEKTALKLLKQFTSLNGIYENIEKVSGKAVKAKLETGREMAYTSRELVIIRDDVPVDVKMEGESYVVPKSIKLSEYLADLQLNQLIKRMDLPLTEQKPQKQLAKKEIIKINNENLLIELVDKMKISNKLYIMHEGIMTISTGDEVVYEISTQKDLLDEGLDEWQVLEAMADILSNEKIKKFIHGAKAFMWKCEKLNIIVNGIVFDTFIGGYLLNPGDGRFSPKQLLFDVLEIDINSPNAGHLVDLVDGMSIKFKELELTKLFENVEMPLINTLFQAEKIGFKVDRMGLNDLGKKFSKLISTLRSEIYVLAGEEFNVNSPKQLGVILFEKLGLQVVTKTKTGYSTGAQVLDTLRGKHDIIDKISAYRQVAKLNSTYVDGLIKQLDKNDIIHTSFNQAVTSTGRISSTEPNLQNIPVRDEMGREIRKVFVATDENHVLVDADYSQIELRVLAHMSKDSTMIDAFKNNQDIHTRTASEIFEIPINEVTKEQRSNAKAVNFGIVYGISDFGLARNIGIPKKKAAEYIKKYWDRYPLVKEFMDKTIEDGVEQGFVSTMMHRRRNMPELKSRNFNIKSAGKRIAMNMPIQGSAADIIKLAMINVHNRLIVEGLESKLVLQVHDELIVNTLKSEVDTVKNILTEEMGNAINLDVPLVIDVSVGDNWYNAK